ncbi:hypothetical protein NPIL_546011 [Nephila pilipes]|uniref:Uncharacterized protein n=1 Tax=Nephila pilipes TaxID=299642 RepID=A0A8X6N717_NEPPI|nr:hypothetical protein NPIL_546011 [Nephila pilipes]
MLFLPFPYYKAASAPCDRTEQRKKYANYLFESSFPQRFYHKCSEKIFWGNMLLNVPRNYSWIRWLPHSLPAFVFNRIKICAALRIFQLYFLRCGGKNSKWTVT